MLPTKDDKLNTQPPPATNMDTAEYLLSVHAYVTAANYVEIDYEFIFVSFPSPA